MCERKAILDILEEHGPCDIHRLARLIHAAGHRVTYMATHLHQLIHEDKVTPSMGIYSLVKRD